jgi:hypothetical protein
MQQLSIFNDIEIQNKPVSLTISGENKKLLSPKQIQFNKLAKKIELLEKTIETETTRCEELFNKYLTDIYPLKKEAAKARINLAMTIGKSTNAFKFGKAQLQKIREIIIDLCNKAFAEIQPSQEEEDFFNQWSGTSYKEELELQEKEAKEDFADFINFMFGTDLDAENIDGSEENMEDVFKKLHDVFENEQNKNSKRKKTKKQLQREELTKSNEILEKKGIRSIYISLVKILHPDTESDPTLRAEKEELMKKVTVAFEEGDLTTLLRLELEWVQKENKHLESATDEKLNIYISAFKKQLAELEKKKYAIRHNPRYMPIQHLLTIHANHAKYEIKNNFREEKLTFDSLKKIINDLKKANQKSTILNFVNEYYALIEEEDEMDDFSDLFY